MSMDVMRYGFGVETVRLRPERRRQRKDARKVPPSTALRFLYVNPTEAAENTAN